MTLALPKIKIMKIKQSINLPILLENNKLFVKEYENNPLIQLIKSDSMKEKSMRHSLLDCIQVFSDYFQKIVMLRYVFCDNLKFIEVAQRHLHEEYGHNMNLSQDREHRPAIWDPVLDASCAWFTWKMFTLDAEEKTVLIHLVLEASAQLFFKRAHQIMDKYQETQYFKIHNEVDEQHEKMGITLLQGLTTEKYQRLQEIQFQGWEVLNTACKQMAILSEKKLI
ncbi:MAG: hypothetical protein REH83_00030 [Rickettsiella sp.]|nr:hypothetical protein [Rickettsiella sp.]